MEIHGPGRRTILPPDFALPGPAGDRMTSGRSKGALGTVFSQFRWLTRWTLRLAFVSGMAAVGWQLWTLGATGLLELTWQLWIDRNSWD